MDLRVPSYNGAPMYCRSPKLYTFSGGISSRFLKPRPHFVSNSVRLVAVLRSVETHTSDGHNSKTACRYLSYLLVAQSSHSIHVLSYPSNGQDQIISSELLDHHSTNIEPKAQYDERSCREEDCHTSDQWSVVGDTIRCIVRPAHSDAASRWYTSLSFVLSG
jgi:hypothetical protein